MDWRDIPSLAALRAFEAAARLESYSAAARTLNVTHAAVAQHVRTLEAHFGLPLMQREGRQMVPTPAGRRLASDLANGFAEIAAGVRALALAHADGPISLTTTPTFAENWLVPRLAAFWADHPEIPLTLAPDNTVQDLRRSGYHLAIRYGRGGWSGVVSTLLIRGNTLAVASPALAARLPKGYTATAPDAVEALTALPWVIDTSFGEFLSWLAAQGVRREALNATEFPSNALVLAACRAGAGVSVQPYAVVRDDLERGSLVALLEQADTSLGYYIVHATGPLSARVKTFVDWLRRAV